MSLKKLIEEAPKPGFVIRRKSDKPTEPEKKPEAEKEPDREELLKRMQANFGANHSKWKTK